jgi:hypothetical protein
MVTVKKKLGPLGQFFLASVFLVAGLAVVYFMGSDTTLICNRAENQCVLQEENIFRGTQITATMNLSDFKGAEIEEGKDSKGNPIYHVMLATDQIRVPFATGKYASCNKTALKINQYLHSAENNLSLTESGTVVMILGFFFAGVGAFVLLQSLAKLFKLMLKLVFVMVQR